MAALFLITTSLKTRAALHDTIRDRYGCRRCRPTIHVDELAEGDDKTLYIDDADFSSSADSLKVKIRHQRLCN